MSQVLSLPSGLNILDPEKRLLDFCAKEFAYYDRVGYSDPDRIEPLDVMVTIAMNSYITRADQVRDIHRGMAQACDPILPRIPVNADLLSFDPNLFEFQGLIRAAVQVRGALCPVATKVLHRKRRNFIPMLDNVVLGHYLTASGRLSSLRNEAQNGRTAAPVAVTVAKMFRDDLRTCFSDIDAIRGRLADAGYPLTPVRILEVLVWTETEKNGYYRSASR